MITLHGIPNCDTVRKARAWLNEHGVTHRFQDLRNPEVSSATLDRWIAVIGWEPLINRKGTTWRNLGEATRASVNCATAARDVMRNHPSLIKRPVVEWGAGQAVTVGFSADEWRQRLLKR